MAATRLDPDPPAPSRAGRARRGPSRWQLVALIVALAVGFTTLAPANEPADAAVSGWPALTESGCEAAARKIKQILDGGENGRITPEPPIRELGEVDGKPNEWRWRYHCVVILDGVVYDALTGPNGEVIAVYQRRFRNAPNIDFPWEQKEC